MCEYSEVPLRHQSSRQDRHDLEVGFEFDYVIHVRYRTLNAFGLQEVCRRNRHVTTLLIDRSWLVFGVALDRNFLFSFYEPLHLSLITTYDD